MIIPYAISLAFVFLSPLLASIGKLNAVIFYIDKSGNYIRGNVMFTVLYIIAGYYALLSVISIWMNRKKFKQNGNLVVLLSFFIVSIIGLAIQTIWPNVLIEWFCVSLAAIVFSYNSQRIEDYVNKETGLYNRNALPVILKKQFDSREPFAVIVLFIDDVALLNQFCQPFSWSMEQRRMLTNFNTYHPCLLPFLGRGNGIIPVISNRIDFYTIFAFNIQHISLND